MTEQEIARLGRRLRKWGPHDVERGLRRLHLNEADRPATRRWVPWTAASAIALAAIVVSAGHLWRRAPAAGPALAGPATGETTLVLEDGSDVTYGRDSDVAVSERSPTRVLVALRAGTARFRVRHDETRLFRVDAGAVQVDDLGTAFVVRRDGARARVSVSEGTVAVSFRDVPGGEPSRVTLRAGESGVYPPIPGSAPAARDEDAPALRDDGAPPSPPRDRSRDTWRGLAKDKDYPGAFRLLSRAGPRGVRDDPTDLLLAADVARLSGHPASALSPLRRVVGRHTRDARAPAAAFTLGWVLMNDLARPRDAAAAFADAERLAPYGNLAEDAAARAAEAWHRAGDGARASSQVRRYVEKYPHGRHRAVLERLVGAP